MPTTIELAPDVEDRVRARMRQRGVGLDEAVNQTLREALPALAATEVRRPPSDPAALRAGLVKDLVQELHEAPFQAYYRQRPHGGVVHGWPERLRAYFWPNPDTTYEVTHELMAPWFEEAGRLSLRLLEGGAWGDAERTSAARLAWTMLEWGGVTQQKQFSERTVEAVFRRALGLPYAYDGEPPMNSGWTKVAALATAFLEGEPGRVPHVIWDSRVSTSLTSRLDRMLCRHGVDSPRGVFPRIGPVTGRGGTRPRPLRLRWAHAYGSWSSQEAGTGLVREIRDHLNGGGYPPMPDPSGGETVWTIRGVESVLFMDGY